MTDLPHPSGQTRLGVGDRVNVVLTGAQGKVLQVMTHGQEYLVQLDDGTQKFYKERELTQV